MFRNYRHYVVTIGRFRKIPSVDFVVKTLEFRLTKMRVKIGLNLYNRHRTNTHRVVPFVSVILVIGSVRQKRYRIRGFCRLQPLD